MDETLIAWTDHTFNPWMGCTARSAGCAHCYAEALTKNRMGLHVWGPTAERRVTSVANWAKPRRWARAAREAGERRRVFCASLCDVLEDRDDLVAPRARLWQLIRDTPELDWQLLTKRPENYARMLPDDWGAGWPHVWLGTTIENQRVAARADALRAVPAAIRFVSYEPALGPLTLDLDGIDWVIYGAESGPRRRPEDKDWARAMRDACARRSVAFFHKQSSHLYTERGIELDGRVIREQPRARRPLVVS